MADFLDECTILEATIQDDAEREKAIEREVASRGAREEAFLTRKRKAGSESSGAWRPRKRHRKSAYLWLVHVDHQIRHGSGYPGIVSFQVAEGNDEPPWHQWPLLSVATDQGSPELCAVNYLMDRRVNLCHISDFAHGCHRDLSLSLKRSGLWAHVLLKITEWNIPHGPWAEDVRQGEVKSCYASFFARYKRPEDSPLFMSLLPYMIWEAGDEACQGGGEVAAIYWQRCQDFSPFGVKGSKTNQNRFLSYLGKGSAEAPLHSMRLLGYLTTCLEQDYLGSTKMAKLLCKSSGQQDGASGARGSTSSARSSDTEVALAKAAANQLAIGALVLCDRGAQVRERAIQIVAAPLQAWYAEVSRESRSVDDSLQWVLKQLKGGFCAHLAAFLQPLRRGADLAWVGIRLPAPARQRLDMDKLYLVEDNERVSMMMHLAFNLIACRVQRCAYLFAGYGMRSALWLCEDYGTVSAELQRFEAAVRADQELQEHTDEVGVGRLVEQSQFRLMSVRQLALGMEETSFEEVSATMKNHLNHRHRRLIASELIENCFNRQKRAKGRDMNRRMDLRRAWGVVLDRKVLSEVNDFKEVRFDGVVPLKGHNLEEGIQHPTVGKCSIDAGPITSFDAKTSWYSPGSDRHCVRFLSQYLHQHMQKTGAWDVGDRTWQGCLFKVEHDILVRRRGDKEKAFFALAQVPGCCCIVWPAVHHRAPRISARKLVDFWTPAESVGVDDLVAIVVDVQDWEALKVEFVSPLDMAARVKAADGGGVRVAAFESTPVVGWLPLLNVAAARAFWELPLSVLKDFCKLLGVEISGSGSLVDILTGLTTNILGCSEADCFPILQRRLVNISSKEAELAEVMVECDEAMKVMDAEERDDLIKAKRAQHSALQDYATFKQALVEKREALKASGKWSATRGAAGKAKNTSAYFPKYPPVPAGMLTQPQARALLPPDSSIWRCLNRGEWAVHPQGFSRRSFAWHVYGENLAAIEAVRYCWRCYLDREGMPIDECLVKNLFSDAAHVAASAAAQSASSSSMAP